MKEVNSKDLQIEVLEETNEVFEVLGNSVGCP